jgi:hypothetical protein
MAARFWALGSDQIEARPVEGRLACAAPHGPEPSRAWRPRSSLPRHDRPRATEKPSAVESAPRPRALAGVFDRAAERLGPERRGGARDALLKGLAPDHGGEPRITGELAGRGRSPAPGQRADRLEGPQVIVPEGLGRAEPGVEGGAGRAESDAVEILLAEHLTREAAAQRALSFAELACLGPQAAADARCHRGGIHGHFDGRQSTGRPRELPQEPARVRRCGLPGRAPGRGPSKSIRAGAWRAN